MLNVELLKQAVKWAEWSHEQKNGEWRQLMWAHQDECGTSYCIAGWIAHEAGVQFDFNTLNEAHTCKDWNGVTRPVAEVASELLGLDEDDTYPLFAASISIEEVREHAEALIQEHG